MTTALHTRVLIIDDSLIARRLVEDALSEAEGIVVVGAASNGRIGIERVHELQPDVVTLDVEMPELDGLATLRRIRAECPHVRVIMFSALTLRAATTTFEALAAGASDYVAKPTGSGMTATRDQIRDQLVPKIRALCLGPPPIAAGAIRLAARTPGVPAQIIAIGASTGGPGALHALLSALPAPLPVPIVIVQHIPRLFSRLLAERLATATAHPVREVSSSVALAPGTVWLAPGDRHVRARRTSGVPELVLDDGPPSDSCRPSVDVLFQSIAETYVSAALGVVLTGMGHDGVRGCQALRAVGARVIVQDEGSSIVWGMPGAVARAGLAEAVLPVLGLAREIRAAGERRRAG